MLALIASQCYITSPIIQINYEDLHQLWDKKEKKGGGELEGCQLQGVIT